jgi:hypothetical protein
MAGNQRSGVGGQETGGGCGSLLFILGSGSSVLISASWQSSVFTGSGRVAQGKKKGQAPVFFAGVCPLHLAAIRGIFYKKLSLSCADYPFSGFVT